MPPKPREDPQAPPTEPDARAPDPDTRAPDPDAALAEVSGEKAVPRPESSDALPRAAASDAALDDELDDAIEATFPASDALALTLPARRPRDGARGSGRIPGDAGHEGASPQPRWASAGRRGTPRAQRRRRRERRRRERRRPSAPGRQPRGVSARARRGSGGEGASPRPRGDGDTSLRLAREVLLELFGPPVERSFAVRFWDGSRDDPEGAAVFTLVLRHEGTLRRMLLPPTEGRMAEAYLRDHVDIEGSVEAATALAEPLAAWFSSPFAALPLLRRLRGLPGGEPETRARRPPRPFRRAGRRHTPEADRRAIVHHYDMGNDFFRLWLDRRMVYSCAYFPEGVEDLDSAQEAKLELVCRKLRLRQGQRLLDIGCGWGALLVHAARHHGVHATGVTLSREQASWARARIEEAGLGHRCTVEVMDYRDLPGGVRWDRIASVGMVEHVGRKMLPTYFGQAYRLLEPGGLFLNHGIVHLNPDRSSVASFLKRHSRRWTSFIDRHVFPDSELATPAAALAPAEAAGFELRDAESLREHYAMTARQWLRRLEARHAEIAALVGEPVYRAWRLYLAGSARLFAAGELGVVQSLLARRDSRGAVRLPRTRADLYADGAPAGRRGGSTGAGGPRASAGERAHPDDAGPSGEAAPRDDAAPSDPVRPARTRI